MRKEMSVAILLGFGIGLLVVFGVITAQTALKQHPQGARSEQESGTPATPAAPKTSASAHSIALTQPQDGQVFSDSGASVAGSTSPLSHVVITTEQDQFFVDADSEGKFSQSVTLVSGENEIHIVSFSPSGDRAELIISVVYTTADF